MVLAAYGLMGVALYYLQEPILFRGVRVPDDTIYHFQQPFSETGIDMDASTHIDLIQFHATDTPQKGVVLYFHGNREGVRHYTDRVAPFTKNGYEVWMPDYPGYGKSTGKRTEQGLYDEALQVYKLARTHYRPDQIIIYGRSLGTGIAAELAAIRDCRMLFLETPYYSLYSLVGIYAWMYPLKTMLHFHFPVYAYLPKVTAPVHIIQGTNDWTIPYFHAAKLKPLLKKGDSFLTIPGGSHNNLNSFPQMQNLIDSLLAGENDKSKR